MLSRILRKYWQIPSSYISVVSIFFLTVSITMGTVRGADPDSLAYTFRQDNLSSNNDLQLNLKHDLDRSTLLINDILRYKVFAHESKTIRDEQFSIEHRLKSDWLWGKNRRKSIRLESNQYKDHRTGLASTITNWALLAGVKRNENLSIYFGGRSVGRYGIVDKGWTTELNLQDVWQFGSQRSAITISGLRDQLAEHLSHSLQMQADYLIRFGNISTFQTTLHRGTRMQSFFTDSLGSSQSRYNEDVQLRNRFVYHLHRNLQLFHRLDWEDQLTEIGREKVGQSSITKFPGEERKRFSLVNETGLELKHPYFSSLSTFKVENSQNKYYIDYAHVLYQLKENLTWQNPGLLDSLSWKTLLSRLEYNTPDTTNDDDRDEWRLNTDLRFVWQPNPFYHLDFGVKLSMFHLIYIFNTRSSENYWNRNFVLESGFYWRRQSWKGESRARIRSNYFDYDYDDLFVEMDQPTRSFVHRSLDLQQQLIYNFNNKWSAMSNLAVRWEDEGQLDWGAFVQQVTSEREQIEVIVKLLYDHHGWQGWIGYLTHERRTEYRAENREPGLWRGRGPLLGLKYRLGNRFSLDADARVISVQDQEREYLLPKVYLTLVYR